MTIQLSSKVGGSLVRLAPDLNYPANATIQTASIPQTTVSGIDVSTGADMVSLSGRFIVSILRLASMTSSTDVDIVLIIDGETIWDDTMPGIASTSFNILGQAADGALESFLVRSSLVLNITQAGETSADLIFSARPIL